MTKNPNSAEDAALTPEQSMCIHGVPLTATCLHCQAVDPSGRTRIMSTTTTSNPLPAESAGPTPSEPRRTKHTDRNSTEFLSATSACVDAYFDGTTAVIITQDGVDNILEFPSTEELTRELATVTAERDRLAADNTRNHDLARKFCAKRDAAVAERDKAIEDAQNSGIAVLKLQEQLLAETARAEAAEHDRNQYASRWRELISKDTLQSAEIARLKERAEVAEGDIAGLTASENAAVRDLNEWMAKCGAKNEEIEQLKKIIEDCDGLTVVALHQEIAQLKEALQSKT